MKLLLTSFLDHIRRLVSNREKPGGSYSVEDYILNLQRDGRLLLRFLARRSDVVAPEVTTGGAEANDTCTDALFDGVETIQRSPKKIPELIQSVDVLSRRANPANVRSIRLTSAYLGMSVEGGEPPRDINSEAFKIRVNIWLLSCCAIVVFALAIGFLADVDYGRRMLKQVESLRQKESTILESPRSAARGF